MRNLALLARNELQDGHYIRKADPTQRYWFDFASSKMDTYVEQYGNEFSLIIAGDEEIPNDYYVLPFPEFAHVFSEPFLSIDEDGSRRRWIGSIDGDLLKVTRFPDRINIKQYKGIGISSVPDLIVASQPSSFEGHTRKAITEARIDQSIFRQRVMENFGGRCALSGIEEQEVLVASHIIPWSIRKDSRLDPRNGILLFSGYDALFDKGLIAFDDDMLVIITTRLNSCSPGLQAVLNSIQGLPLSSPRQSINLEYLRWHRENKFL